MSRIESRAGGDEASSGAAAGPAQEIGGARQGLLWLAVLGLVYLLLIAVGILSQGFRAISGGADGAAAIFEFATNPIVGVILGVLATALVQSSSAVTSVIVGLVGGGLPVAIAIPMILGSNMGTTVTNTLAALGNLKEDKAFNRSDGRSCGASRPYRAEVQVGRPQALGGLAVTVLLDAAPVSP
jgi:sodium-dependent phosphate cotransporter